MKLEYWWCVTQEKISIIILFDLEQTKPFQPSRSSKTRASIYLRLSAHLALSGHVCSHQCCAERQWAVLVWERHLHSHHQIHPGGCLNAKPCLLIAAWHMVVMLINFIKPPPFKTSPTLFPFLPNLLCVATQPHPAAWPQQLCHLKDFSPLFFLSERWDIVIVNNGFCSK